ncbi:ADP-ribosylglycohydrolase family protein [Algoriphagus sediminis]|uniref:ADP-ribosylglycohydrolase family protein n=1 Tax=Algoriphagus sediminis TaxID=3057113 RepID=A0ABT7YGI4_9BACT|nr:ADP-ribosylglycohydrolase family protein [Algoriphagus sediminis]MDN3205586.1 ADP-ribosylglycohydrolase family protein [Algoriphagus sediminis]
MKFKITQLLFIAGLALACEGPKEEITGIKDPNLNYAEYTPGENDLEISRTEYADKLYGFWLGQCIANWTGLVTEMDKIGGEGIDGRGAGFYTRENWGGPDEPAIWEETAQDRKIDFVLTKKGEPWGADDDTDIEYIYQWLMYTNQTTQLTGEQIRDGWLKHIYSDENTPFTTGDEETPENFLWVSNQTAHDLMREEGLIPPETSDPENNKDYEMIDAQLTTEIFGFFAPTKPELAREIAELPIRTTARENAEWAAQFYVTMYSLASSVDQSQSMKDQVMWLAEEGRETLPEGSAVASMYDFVKQSYEDGVAWETTRDSLHIKYQINQEAGYDWYEKDPVCHGCFAGGINFGASLVSLFYGEGDIVETIKIGVLAGWDSDNPTATWGGLLGFMIGKEGVEKAFGNDLSETFNIHRTRGGFPNDGIDSFENMAQTGVFIVDRMVQERMDGGVDLVKNVWYIPQD